MLLIHRLPSRRDAGFSLVELIVLIVIMSILAIVATPLFESRAFEQRGFYDEVSWAARYARTLAVTSGCEVQMSIPNPNSVPYSPNSYVLNQRAANCTTGAFDRAVTHPGNGLPMSAVAPALITLSMANNPVVFKPLGNTSDQTNRTVTVGTQSFTIIGVTGFVREVPP